ncbi:MAG: phospholipid carrier-dependent glycosyltransferase [bacterium]|nr:phospholipid carrier-dependent glycosyltransferase [bacterium]
MLTISLILPLFLGWQLVVLLERKTNIAIPKLLKFGFGFGLGFGLVSWIMFLFTLIVRRWHLSLLTISVVVFAVILGIMNRNYNKLCSSEIREFIPRAFHTERKNLIPWILIILLAVQIIYVFSETVITPFIHWDSWAIWGLKGRIFYTEQTIPKSYFQLTAREFGHPDYPLLIPLSETWLALWINEWNESLVKILSPLYYLLILILCYYFVSKEEKFNLNYPLLFTVILATIPQMVIHGTLGLADLPLAYYGFASFILVYWWFQTEKMGWLIYAAIFAGLAMWTKNEGVALFLITGIICVYLSGKKKGIGESNLLSRIKIILLAYFVPALVIYLPWFLFKIEHNIQNDLITWNRLIHPEIYLRLSRIPTLLMLLSQEMLNWKNWNIFWVAFIILLMVYCFSQKDIKKIYINATLIYLVLYLLMIIGIYTISIAFVTYHPAHSLDRILIHIVPQVAILLYLLFSVQKT